MESTLRTNISELWAKLLFSTLLIMPINGETVEDGWGRGWLGVRVLSWEEVEAALPPLPAAHLQGDKLRNLQKPHSCRRCLNLVHFCRWFLLLFCPGLEMPHWSFHVARVRSMKTAKSPRSRLCRPHCITGAPLMMPQILSAYYEDGPEGLFYR